MTVITCNLNKDYNLGGPSILLGLDQLLKEIYPNHYKIINLQAGENPAAVDDGLPMETFYYYPPTKRYIFRFLFGYKNHVGLAKLISIIKKADIVVDLYGICFCDSLSGAEGNETKYRLWDFGAFTIAVISKLLLKKQVVKNMASYGPMHSKYNTSSAKYMCTNIFDKVAAREGLSRKRIAKVLKDTDILLAPDIANLMPYRRKKGMEGKITVSVSHRIEKEWKSTEAYVDCISNLCRFFAKEKMEVMIVPNECKPSAYTDVSVAEKIRKKLKEQGIAVSILPVAKMAAQDIKNVIASSKLMVGSRYHSCVAALSSGVPTIVIGWHNKYEELLEKYGQSKWYLSCGECTSEKLISMVADLLANYEKEKATIIGHRPDVQAQVLAVGRKLFIV